ncbi:MAG: hypothetical protein UZ06_CHB003000758 [Chlorobi bacterium OLB6]|nr:MAG: hypothetical protein UZ06_CHB003000758 [Chlorobi bacterium OLB6]
MSTRDDDLLHRASKLQRRIVFPDSSDERTVRAVQELQHLALPSPFWLLTIRRLANLTLLNIFWNEGPGRG